MVEVSCYGYFICLFMPCTAETLFTFMLLLDYSSLKVESEISTASEEKQRGHVDRVCNSNLPGPTQRAVGFNHSN